MGGTSSKCSKCEEPLAPPFTGWRCKDPLGGIYCENCTCGHLLLGCDKNREEYFRTTRRLSSRHTIDCSPRSSLAEAQDLRAQRETFSASRSVSSRSSSPPPLPSYKKTDFGDSISRVKYTKALRHCCGEPLLSVSVNRLLHAGIDFEKVRKGEVGREILKKKGIEEVVIDQLLRLREEEKNETPHLEEHQEVTKREEEVREEKRTQENQEKKEEKEKEEKESNCEEKEEILTEEQPKEVKKIEKRGKRRPLCSSYTSPFSSSKGGFSWAKPPSPSLETDSEPKPEPEPAPSISPKTPNSSSPSTEGFSSPFKKEISKQKIDTTPQKPSQNQKRREIQSQLESFRFSFGPELLKELENGETDDYFSDETDDVTEEEKEEEGKEEGGEEGEEREEGEGEEREEEEVDESNRETTSSKEEEKEDQPKSKEPETGEEIEKEMEQESDKGTRMAQLESFRFTFGENLFQKMEQEEGDSSEEEEKTEEREIKSPQEFFSRQGSVPSMNSSDSEGEQQSNEQI